ncbi:fungal specific transcription factor domain-containing protein [Phanerochaete sordida]|uniref:Fungal specific transcription factor domain-containing protein n=1 Tax=Phanerochaete sordida TaxID=48140 RepID=A0A9P3LD56_9APHY|nr:fungal specific transcription factor domain-containing protein [Phanerochaete sordida]
MAEKRTTAAGPSTSTNTLQRGKACLRCRKRKMKCDGAKPACQQCAKAKKSDACEYDDGKGKTRTQLMREHIARLELRIKELETSDNKTSPPVTLFDPHAVSPYLSESSSSSSHDSPGAFSLSASASPVPFPLDADTPSWEDQWGSLNEFAASQIAGAFTPDEPPLELAQMLLEIFLPHRHQCGLDVHVGRLRESLNRPQPERRHPVLMNAIYLWACYMSRPGNLSDHESLYLARALAALTDAIANPDKVIDLIQAQCILSYYFLSNGRLLEGSYHASSAASLAIQWGLHQIGSADVTPSSVLSDWDASFRLDPPADAIEQGERVLTFWQVYNLDRCWSVALQRPSIIPDSKHPRTAILTPWPQRMEEYEAGELDVGSGSPIITAFFMHQAQATALVGGFSSAALHVKASALFEGSQKLSSSWNPRLPSSTNFSENFRAFDSTISRFISTLPLLHAPDNKYTMLLVHSLAHTSMVRLHQPFIADDQMSRDKSLRAARSVVVVVKHIAEADYDYLDPLIGTCWMTASRVLAFEIAQMQASWPPMNSTDLRNELGTLLYALTKLGARFPLLGYEASKMQKMLDTA